MSESALTVLSELRNEIDALDAQIIQSLGRRFEICRRVARLKKDQSIPMMQPGRVEAVKKRCMEMGIENGLDPTFVNEIYSLIIGESCVVETGIIEGESD